MRSSGRRSGRRSASGVSTDDADSTRQRPETADNGPVEEDDDGDVVEEERPSTTVVQQTRTTITTTKAPSTSPRSPPSSAPVAPAQSSGSGVSSFLLLTKPRVQLWIPLLLSLLLAAALLHWRSTHLQPMRTGQAPDDQPSLSDHLTRAKRAVVEAAGLDHWDARYPDQYASHPSDKDRARSLVNELHGVAAQIRQAEQDEHHLHFHPLDGAPSPKDLDRETRRLRGESRGLLASLLDWSGLRRVLPQGLTAGADEDHVDRHDYLRDEAAKPKPTVYEDTADAEGKRASLTNTLKAELQQLKGRFLHFTQQAKDAINNRLAPPFHDKGERKAQTSDASQTTETQTASTSTPVHSHDGAASDAATGNESNESLILSRPDHPLLDPLHDILSSVDSMTSTPLLPAPPEPEGWWQRFMSTLFPSHLEEHTKGLYQQAREEVKQDAVKLRELMKGEYDDIKRQLKDMKADVVEGKGEPLELYEQYNAEPVHTHDQPIEASGKQRE